MDSISIIIRAYNEERHIGKLLAGIQEQTLGAEVILVDSGSTDATVPIASHFNVKVVSIAPEDFSFGRALNLGCSVASGEILVFASAHVYPVYTDWLNQMVDPFKDDRVALVYGKQRGNDLTQYSEKQIFRKWFPDESDYDQAHPFCNNANTAIRKDLWKEFKYDEQLTGLEDLDWGKRLLSVGYKIVYNASAEIIHVHEETSQKIRNRYRREAIALKQIMPQQHFSLIDFFRLLTGNVFSDWIHALREGQLHRHFFDILIFRYMQFSGTYKGYRDKNHSKSLRQRFYYPNTILREKKEHSEQQRAINYAKYHSFEEKT